MTISHSANTYTLGGGTSPSNAPVVAKRAPGIYDVAYPIRQQWVYPAASSAYVLASLSGNPVQASWVSLGNASGNLNTLSDGSTTVTPTAGNIEILGTASEITSTGTNSPGAITLSLPSSITAPGSLTTTTTLASGTTLTAGSTLTVTTNASVGGTLGVTGTSTLAALTQAGTAHINVSGAATTVIGTGGTGAVQIGNATGNTAVTGSLTASTTLTATLGAITATNGNLVLGHTGNKLVIHASTAASDSVGTSAALSSGSVTVSTTAVTANSIILLSPAAAGGTQGNLSVGTVTAGMSFEILSDNSSDTSTVNYLIIN